MPFSELLNFNPVVATMIFYIAQGFVITILNIPLLLLLTVVKKNRDRKEFVLIAIVSVVDFFYVIINCINSYNRIVVPSKSIPRLQCVSQPLFFLSLVASQLLAGMPLMIAIDRFIASFSSFWYYKQSTMYSVCICITPIFFGFAISMVNNVIIATTPDQNSDVMSLCFTSMLPAPIFKIPFYAIKWLFIVLAGSIYGTIAFFLKMNKKYSHRAFNRKINTANRVMGLSTFNSICFHLIPDILLVFPPKVDNTIALQCLLYSLILDKILFDFLLYMVFHKELRKMYISMFICKSKPQPSSLQINSGRLFATR